MESFHSVCVTELKVVSLIPTQDKQLCAPIIDGFLSIKKALYRLFYDTRIMYLILFIREVVLFLIPGTLLIQVFAVANTI